MKNIKKILRKNKCYSSKKTIFYGDHIAKIPLQLQQPPANSKLILVTATSPTKAGEGKTTVSVGLADGLNLIKKRAVIALREPSLGPCLGMKGGATGGGKSVVLPIDDINMHFTGDFHAITTANNLVSAMIENNIYWGNSLNIDPKQIVWKRCIDMNDRGLRAINISIRDNIKYDTGFDITAASMMMAIFCLAKDLEDLKTMIGRSVVAYSKTNKPITIDDLQITNAILNILKQALLPNAVQTANGTLALIHGGPFANIAHGTNSVLSTITAMNIADYTVTECGFGSDLGVEKYFNIVCRKTNIYPDVVVLVTTLKATKLNGGVKEDKLDKPNEQAIRKGFKNNVLRHINNLKAFNANVVATINLFESDTQKEIELMRSLFAKEGIDFVASSPFIKGSEGMIDLANLVVAATDIKTDHKLTYNSDETIEQKIRNIVTKNYGVKDVEFTPLANKKLSEFKSYNHYSICVAKTQYQFAEKVNGKEKIVINDIILNNGCGFVVVMAGSVFRMPGLNKTPRSINFK